MFDSMVWRARTSLVRKPGAGWNHAGRFSRLENGGV